MFPPAGSPLLRWTASSSVLASTLALEIVVNIFEAEAALLHHRACPSAIDQSGYGVVRLGHLCRLAHCPHDTSPTYTLVHVCRGWNKAKSVVTLWSTLRLRLDMDFNSTRDIENLLVYNRAEYEFCVEHSGRSDLKLSIGCDPQQRRDIASGRAIVKGKMKLNVGTALERLVSLCFNGNNGRLVAALSLMDAPKLQSVHILGGAFDSRWKSEMFMVRDSTWMTSGTVQNVYCSVNFDDTAGPLTFQKGYEKFKLLDLSSAGAYDEAVVEWILALAPSLEDLRIHASIKVGARASALPNAHYAIRGVSMPDRVVSRVRRLRIAHSVGQSGGNTDRRNLLSRFTFPDLKELVLHYCHAVTSSWNVGWLMRSPFPSLTIFQVTVDSIPHNLLGNALRGMPALKELTFAPHSTWSCHVSWGPATYTGDLAQDSSFLGALRAASRTLEVLKLGGDAWFTSQQLVAFLAARESGGALRILSLGRWYTVKDREALEAVRAAALPLRLDCAEYARCPFAITTGTRAHGAPPSSWEEWECSACKRDHVVTKVYDIPAEELSVEEAKRAYWGAF